MEVDNQSYYWVNTDLIDIKNDPDLKNHKDSFILGKMISKDDFSVTLTFEINKKQITKSFGYDEVILTSNDNKQITTQNNLSQSNNISAYDTVLHILNNYNKNTFYNFIDDNILLTYLKYPLNNVIENYFENYLLINDYQKNLFFNPSASHNQFDHLKDNIKKALSNDQEDYSQTAYDEMFLKLTERFLIFEKNLEIKFFSNYEVDYNTNFEEIKFLIQNFSVYNKHKIFREKEVKQKFEKEYKIYDLVYNGLKLLEMFGCGTKMNSIKSDYMSVPRFNFNLKLSIDKNLNHCKHAEILISSFNRDAFDIYSNCETSSERIFNIFHILNQQSPFSKYSNDTQKEKEMDEENLQTLTRHLWQIFNFNIEEVNLIKQLLGLIITLSNLELFQSDKSLYLSDLSLASLREILEIKEEEVNDKIFSDIFINNEPMMTKEDCKVKVNTLIKDIYENLFYFIVKKINKQLAGSLLYDKQIVISSFFNSAEKLSNPFDFINLFNYEKTLKDYEDENVNNYLAKLNDENFKIRKVESKFDIENKKLFETLENFAKQNLIEQTNENVNCGVCNFILENNKEINIPSIIKTNFISENKNLINLAMIMKNEIFNEILNTVRDKRNIFIEFVEKKENLNNFHKFTFVNLSENFYNNSNQIVLKNSILSSLTKLRMKSYIENVLNKYPHCFTLRQFVDRFAIPVIQNTNKIEDSDIVSVSKDIVEKASNTYDSFMINNYSIIVNNAVYIALHQLEKTYLNGLKQNDKVIRTLAILKGFTLRLSIKKNRLLPEKPKIKQNIKKEEDKEKLLSNEKVEEKLVINESKHSLARNESVQIMTSESKHNFYRNDSIQNIIMNEIKQSIPMTRNESLQNYQENKNTALNNALTIDQIETKIKQNKDISDIDKNLSLDDSFKETRIMREIDSNKKKKIELNKMNAKLIEKYSDSSEVSMEKNIKDERIISTNEEKYGNRIDSLSNEDKIVLIQGVWRSKQKYLFFKYMRQQVFLIQRTFRKYLTNKYNLPDNYFYNEKFLRQQFDKFEKNYIENVKILFPNNFYNSSKIDNRESINFNKTPKHSAYEDQKIHLYAKILDFDLMVDTDEVYDNIWANGLDKVFNTCINNNTPIQKIALGNAHTICVNNKGKVYTFGWNNFGQCGVPVNSSIIAKYELENDYLIEMNELNELKPKVLNKIESFRNPQFDEIVQAKTIESGEDHTLVLDSNGTVWAFGLNLNGQLGLGHTFSVEKPTKIPAFNKVNITNIKCEGDISFAINENGESYMWPWLDKTGTLKPEPLKLHFSTPKEKITSISCGSNFVLMLNQQGMVYSMGKSNIYGQLGQGDFNPRYRPTLIEFFVQSNERISQISCGFKHCVAKSNTGHVFTWGLGVKGQLGHDNYNNYSIPYNVIVDGPLTKVIQVSAGFRSTFFLTDTRKVYFTGSTGSITMQSVPILHNIWENIQELSNEQNYSIVKINNSWNRSFSIFYAVIADTTLLQGINLPKLNLILSNLSSKWESDSVDPPYIESLAKYFPSSFMKKCSKDSNQKK